VQIVRCRKPAGPFRFAARFSEDCGGDWRCRDLRRRRVQGLLAALILCSSFAHAQTVTPAPAPAADATALFQKAVELQLRSESENNPALLDEAVQRYREVLALKPDGVFLSNGPGDPEPCDYAIRAIAAIVDGAMPTFGICLGHQLLGLASGAKTVKMKFGHHGANHPVLDKDTGQVLITSQNHGFAVDPSTLPATVRVTHVSLFDGSLQGIARTDRPAFGFQGHPEASPGPHDVAYLFDRFVKLMESRR